MSSTKSLFLNLIQRDQTDDGVQLYGAVTFDTAEMAERCDELNSQFADADDKNDDDVDKDAVVEGTASIPNEIFNMFKNLVGAGVLGLPSGVAAFGNSRGALCPTILILIIMGFIFGYYFLLVGRICQMTNTRSYREAWETTVGRGAWIVALNTALMAGLGNLAYSMILADTSRSLLSSAGLDFSRTTCLIGVTVIVLFPICLVRNLEMLAPFSIVGLAGMLFTVIVMVIRCKDGSYTAGGRYANDLPPELRPSFGSVGASGAANPQILLLVCMTFQAYFAHYNAPRYYHELKKKNVPRFTIAVASSFTLAMATYAAVAAAGFLTFGKNADGFILNNYSTEDALAGLCRFAIAMSLAFTYPLPFLGVRDGILDLLQIPLPERTPAVSNTLTICMHLAFTGLANRFRDLGLVNAVGGGALGTCVVFVYPTMMYRGAIRNMGREATDSQHREAFAVLILMWIGIVIGSIGVVVGIFPDLIS